LIYRKGWFRQVDQVLEGTTGNGRKTMRTTLKNLTIATSAFVCAVTLSFGWTEQGGVSLSVESAQARVGRPLTPVSVAGVARRTSRRAYYGAAAAGAAAAGTAYYYGSQPSNGYVCQPGTYFVGQDDHRHLCQ
jgi:hypothetical protein